MYFELILINISQIEARLDNRPTFMVIGYSTVETPNWSVLNK